MDLSPTTDSSRARPQDTTLPPIRPSLTFLAILAATVGAGIWLWSVNDGPSWGVFVFATIGWILSLTMHEFALAFLGVLQIGATVLNLIPVPGLDGFGIINPHLSPELRAKIRPVSSKGIWIVLALLWFVPPANRAFWDLISAGVEIFGVNGDVASGIGFREYQFWR